MVRCTSDEDVLISRGNVWRGSQNNLDINDDLAQALRERSAARRLQDLFHTARYAETNIGESNRE